MRDTIAGDKPGADDTRPDHAREDALWHKLCADLSMPPPGPDDDVLSAMSLDLRAPDDARWLSETPAIPEIGSSAAAGAGKEEITDPLYWFARDGKANLAELDAGTALPVTSLAPPGAEKQQRAMAAALGACFHSLLPLFDPESHGRPAISGPDTVFSWTGKRHRRLWQQYQQHYRQVSREADSHIAALFQSVFLPVYEQHAQQDERTAASPSVSDITDLIRPVR